MAACALLSWCVSVRWPAPTSPSALALPALDVLLLLGLWVLFGSGAGRPSRRACTSAAGVLVLLRLGRIADGVCLRYFDRRFHLVADLPLIPELARLGRSSLGTPRFALACVALVLASYVLWRLMAASLALLMHSLARPRAGDAYLLGVSALAVVAALAPARLAPFSASVAPRLLHELALWLQARGELDDPQHAAQRRDFDRRFEARQARLRAAPTDLSASGKPDVHVLLVEAYGHTVQATPAYVRALAPAYRDFLLAVWGAGFQVCTRFVRATTFGGNSWLTHASLQSSVPINDQFEYSLLLERSSQASLARAFAAAGYRSVSVKPGTTRPTPQTRIYGFEREYVAADFGYRGRSYAWSPMPDQFVLEQIAARELRAPARPLYVEYALVTSHFPWTPQPQYVPDAQSLGDGALYRTQPPLTFEQPQGELSAQASGYVNSLRYELRVLSDYLLHHVTRDALVLVLGDHQPIAPVAGEDRSRMTPLHVLSRRPELLAPLAAHGCSPGLHAPLDGPALGMEDVGLELLQLLSGAPLSTAAGAP